jgi:hypothetical protein
MQVSGCAAMPAGGDLIDRTRRRQAEDATSGSAAYTIG